MLSTRRPRTQMPVATISSNPAAASVSTESGAGISGSSSHTNPTPHSLPPKLHRPHVPATQTRPVSRVSHGLESESGAIPGSHVMSAKLDAASPEKRRKEKRREQRRSGHFCWPILQWSFLRRIFFRRKLGFLSPPVLTFDGRQKRMGASC